jgi:adenylate cyclase
MIGFPETALRISERGIALAKEIGHPPSTAFALASRTSALCQDGDAQGVLSSFEEASRFASEERLAYYEPILSILRGWALSETGDPQGLAVTKGGLDRYKATGNGIEQTRFYSILAAQHWQAGQWDEAFRILENTAALAAENGEGFYEPELYRLRGEFLFEQATGRAPQPKTGADRQTQLAEAESCIRESLLRARRQEAKMLELRSLVSLCRLRRESGPAAGDRDALAELYGTFTEGFETPDLRQAKATFESLAS